MTFNATLHDKAVIVRLNCAFSWGTITDKAITDETNQDKGACRNAMHVRKKLLPDAAGKHVKELQTILSTFYGYHKSRTYSTTTDGDRLMPTAFHFDYEEHFNTAKSQADDALETLIDTYDGAVEQAKQLLGSAFKPDDYPDAEEIRRYYKFKKQFLPVPSGDQILKAMGASVASDVDSYVGHILTSAAADAKDRLRKAVLRMQESCRPKGKIYDSMIDSIDDLVQSLPEIAGLTMDPELQKMVDDVRRNLTGFAPKDLRESEGTRTLAAKAAADIMKRMGG